MPWSGLGRFDSAPASCVPGRRTHPSNHLHHRSASKAAARAAGLSLAVAIHEGDPAFGACQVSHGCLLLAQSTASKRSFGRQRGETLARLIRSEHGVADVFRQGPSKVGRVQSTVCVARRPAGRLAASKRDSEMTPKRSAEKSPPGNRPLDDAEIRELRRVAAAPARSGRQAQAKVGAIRALERLGRRRALPMPDDIGSWHPTGSPWEELDAGDGRETRAAWYARLHS